MNTDTPSLNLEPGVRLAGVYHLQSALDTGGSPAVWLAEDEVLGKAVALHFLPAAVATDERALAEIRLEVKRMRPLIHPGVLRVYDLVEGDGWAAVATEAFEGRRLSVVLEEHGRYEVSELDPWLDQVCVALEEAHRIKLLHRDLSPENLFVKKDGRLLVANFGIGRAVQSSLLRANAGGLSAARLSSTPPQLLDGTNATPTDDVYGVGALFYHLIAGEPVFSGDGILAQIRNAVPPRLSDVRFDADDEGEEIPPAWENVIAACLNKSRDERPASPAEVVGSIEAYAAPVESQAKPNGPSFVSPPEPPTVLASSLPVIAAASSELPPLSLVRDPVPIPPEETVVEEPVSWKDEPESVVSIKESLVEKSASADEAPAPEEPVVAKESEAAFSHPIEPTAAPTAESDVPASRSEAPAAPERELPPSRTPYETDDDAFSSILPKRYRFPLAVAASVALVLVLINNGSKREKTPEAPSVRPLAMNTDTSDSSELTAVKNTARETVSAPAEEAPQVPAPPLARETAAPDPTATSEILLAAGPKTKIPASAAPAPVAAPATTGDPIADKAAALNKLKADLAATEEQEQARLREKQAAEAAAAEAQKSIEAKAQAAAVAKKETQDLLALRKQREEEQKSAELAAQAAQQLAAEKLRAAEDARKALADFEAKNKAKLASQDKVDAELQSLQRTIEEKRKAADDANRAAEAASMARQQRRAQIEQAEKELAEAQASAAKMAEENQRKMAVDSERKRLDDEINAMRALFEQKMKDIEDRRRQLEGGSATAPAAAPVPAPVVSPSASVPVSPQAATPPPATLPLMAARTEPPAVTPALPPPSPAVAPVEPAPAGAVTNSLGLRFVPVGEVYFSAWLTRWKDFDTFARAVNLKSTAWRGPGFRQGPDHPVVNVTWNEAIAFCKWLTDKEHKEGVLPANQFYRLPYDLEWSAAVGLPKETGKTPEDRDMGVPDVYPWGNAWPPPKGAGNYTGEETGSDVAIKGYDDGFAWTSPVGSFPANKLGLFDMGGNVWQWCMDTWNADSKARTLRGASWYNGALKLSLLASCRVKATPDSSTDNYGFRIVRASEATAAKGARR